MAEDKTASVGGEVIELVGDKGDVLKLVHIGTIDYNGGKYAFFQPDGEDEEETVVFKIGKDGEDEVLLPIEDDKVLNEVFSEFLRLLDEEED